MCLGSLMFPAIEGPDLIGLGDLGSWENVMQELLY
jgi:hypothetical protein